MPTMLARRVMVLPRRQLRGSSATILSDVALRTSVRRSAVAKGLRTLSPTIRSQVTAAMVTTVGMGRPEASSARPLPPGAPGGREAAKAIVFPAVGHLRPTAHPTTASSDPTGTARPGESRATFGGRRRAPEIAGPAPGRPVMPSRVPTGIDPGGRDRAPPSVRRLCRGGALGNRCGIRSGKGCACAGELRTHAQRAQARRAVTRRAQARRALAHQGWCPGAESNHRHCDFQSHALPTELPGRDRVRDAETGV